MSWFLNGWKNGGFNYVESGGGGDTPVMELGLITSMLSQSGLSAFNAENLLSDAHDTNGFYTEASVAGSFLKIDFGAGNEQSLCRWMYHVDVPEVVSWNIQYSDDDNNWTTVATLVITQTYADNIISWSPGVKHRYWRSYKVSPIVSGGGGYHEVLKVYG